MMMRQVGVFAGVGVFATVTHVVTALAAAALLGVGPQVANLMGFLAAVCLSYLGHAHLTFGHPMGHAVHGSRFIVLSLSGLVLSSAITFVLCTLMGAPLAAAMAMVAVTVPVFTYLGGRFWAFADAPLDRSALGGLLVSLLVGVATVAIFWSHPINADSAWFLIATRKWLEGARLYVDVIEVNPPLNFYLTVPAIWLADALSISDTHAQYVVVGLLTAISLAWVDRLLANRTDLTVRKRLLLLGCIGAALTLPMLRAMAQREHLMLIFLLPYLFGFLTGQAGQDRTSPDKGRGAIARAAYAAIGLCIKPHFMAIPLALTIVRMIETRSLRPVFAASNITILATGLAYVAFILKLHPEYLDDVVPLASTVYGGFGLPWDSILRNMKLPVIGVFLVLAAFGPRSAGTPEIRLLAVFLASVAIYAVQWKGFSNHAMPIFSIAALGFILVILGKAQHRARPMLAICGLTLLLLPTPLSGFYRNDVPKTIGVDSLSLPPQPAILVVSTNVPASMSLTLELEGTWVSRYPSLWLLPGARKGLRDTDCVAEPDTCAKFEAILKRMRDDTIDDMTSGRPDLLVFDKPSAYGQKSTLNYQDFLGEDARFEDLMDDYRHVRETKQFSVWTRIEQ